MTHSITRYKINPNVNTDGDEYLYTYVLDDDNSIYAAVIFNDGSYFPGLFDYKANFIETVYPYKNEKRVIYDIEDMIDRRGYNLTFDDRPIDLPETVANLKIMEWIPC